MITKLRLKELIEYKALLGSPTLSVYLNIDQSDAANLNRMFEVSLFNVLREVEETLDNRQLSDFKADAIRVQNFVEGYRPQAKGLIIFCDSSEDFFWAHDVHVPVKTEVRWSEKPYLRPLLEIIDEHERYGVILTDRSQARLFSIFLGEIEEYHEALCGDGCDAHQKRRAGPHPVADAQSAPGRYARLVALEAGGRDNGGSGRAARV